MRGIPLPRQGPRQLGAELHRLKLDRRVLRPGQLGERGRTDGHDPVPIAALPMEQRGRGLDQPLPHLPFCSLNNRTPDGFQGFVREPEFAGVEQFPGVLQVAPALFAPQGRTRNRLTAP